VFPFTKIEVGVFREKNHKLFELFQIKLVRESYLLGAHLKGAITRFFFVLDVNIYELGNLSDRSNGRFTLIFSGESRQYFGKIVVDLSP
jgi:hypothetical protein